MKIRSIIKNTIYGGSHLIGLTAAKRWALKHRLLVLAYHGVVPDEYAVDYYHPLYIGMSEFCQHLELLCRYFRPVSPSDVLDWVIKGRPLPERSVLVTFDDGYRNNLIYAAPELERYGVAAQIAVATGHIGADLLLWTTQLREQILHWTPASLPMPNGMRDVPMPKLGSARFTLAEYVVALCKRLDGDQRQSYLELLRNEWTPELEIRQRQMFDFLSWDEVRLLYRRGFTIGAHTVNHPILTTLSAERVDQELRGSKAAIERELNAPCVWLTYPNGGLEDVNPRIVHQARAAGFEIGLTLAGSLNGAAPCPLYFDRMTISEKDHLYVFEVYTSGIVNNFHMQRAVRPSGGMTCSQCPGREKCRFFRENSGSPDRRLVTRFFELSHSRTDAPMKVAKGKARK